MFKKYFVFLFTALFLLTLLAGCGGDSSTTPVTPLPTSVPTATSIPTEVPTALPSNVTELTFVGGQAGGNVTANDVVAVFSNNKSNPESGTYAYTVDSAIAAAETSSSYEPPVYKGGEDAEKLYQHIRENTKELVELYGDCRDNRPSEISSSDTQDVLGNSETFWVYNDETEDDQEITATLKHIGTYCYVYVDDTSGLNQTQIDQVGEQWDGNIYPSVTSNFGSPPDAPNGQGETRIYLLLSPALNGSQGESNPGGLYGYFWSRDQYPVSLVAHSNYRNIVYFNSAYPYSGDMFEFNATLAHEFQHMVNWNYKRGNELSTFDEGMAMLAELLAGYSLPKGSSYAYNVVKAFQVNPDNYSITDWERGGSYGMSFLFMCYVYDLYGGAKIKELVSGSANGGIENIENVLGTDFDALFRDWLIANLWDGTVQGNANQRFHYTSIEMSGNPGGTYYGTLPGIQTNSLGNGNNSLLPWGVNYMASGGTGAFTVNGSNLGGLLFNN